MPLVKTCKAWDDLTESLLAAGKDYDDHGKDRWHRIWYGLGDKADVVMPWTEIIPNEYGLAIVKTGVAAILRVGNCLSVSLTVMPMADETKSAGEEVPGKAAEGFAGLRGDPKSHDIG